jgi:hypothetical protein
MGSSWSGEEVAIAIFLSSSAQKCGMREILLSGYND